MENITNIKTINSNKILLITDNVTAFNKTKKLLCSQIINPQLNINKMDFKMIEEENEFKKIINTIPFMDSKRVILMELPLFKTGVAKKINGLLKALKGIPDETNVFLYSYIKDKRTNINKNSEIKKFIKNDFFIINGEFQSDYVKKVCNSIFARHNTTITNEALDLFVNKTLNIDIALQEIKKLLCLNKNTLDIEDIINCISSYNDDDIFDLTDSISKKDVNGYFNTLKNLLDKGEKPVSVFYTLLNHIKMLQEARLFQVNNHSLDSFVKFTGKNPYYCKLIYESSNNFTKEELDKSLIAFMGNETRIKFSSNPNIVLEELSFKLFCN
ncbi:DNA polymerase III subunit delta [Clostridium botulinum]|uniref:DNA polymerase III subunit delta n=1 Tax=Clostridium botulinum TaxID=1491 RepID=UPI00174E7DB5|nr:DNA polymerase III subunit delta [Clostridium botulinum]MBD5640081.1 DNA polymerase III subunit delta [Clostridium botulinum]MDI6919997.1 DNA polymerase III subunit delta [Clostridium botulinum]WMU99608.1 DNA polymerase III subunit delta [Clostridium botulinum]